MDADTVADAYFSENVLRACRVINNNPQVAGRPYHALTAVGIRNQITILEILTAVIA